MHRKELPKNETCDTRTPFSELSKQKLKKITNLSGD